MDRVILLAWLYGLYGINLLLKSGDPKLWRKGLELWRQVAEIDVKSN